jgi:hypothetical protein
MSKSDSEGENNQLRAEGPFTSFFRLDAHSSVPTEFRSPSTFTIDSFGSPIVAFDTRSHASHVSQPLRRCGAGPGQNRSTLAKSQRWILRVHKLQGGVCRRLRISACMARPKISPALAVIHQARICSMKSGP